MAFCSKCGTQVQEGTKFCQNCGNDVSGLNSEQQVNTAQTNHEQSGYTQTDMNGNYNQPNYNQPNYNQPNYGQQNAGGNLSSFMNTADTTAQYSMDDIKQNKVMAVVAYLGILWLIPFFGAKHSPFAKYHVKQAFPLACAETVWWLVSFIINFAFRDSIRISNSFKVSVGTPWGISLILWLVNLVLLGFAVLGIVNAAQGRAKELPVIGKMANKFTFLK